MRTRASDMLRDHFGVDVTADTLEDLRVWEGCSNDPFYEVSLVAAVFVTHEEPLLQTRAIS